MVILPHKTDTPTAIVVHGGAGGEHMQGLAERLEGCRAAARAGYRVLLDGGSALDAVETAVVTLEDNPLFNAGTGSVVNSDGECELDASIMDGPGLRAGAVAALKDFRNPIRVARRVLNEGRHVLLTGPGAAGFAGETGFIAAPVIPRVAADSPGTVGAVAVDRAGRCAAATSTGGTGGKRPGRVGDSALIGCGTYAGSAGAVSCTGQGEAIIRVVMAKTAYDLLSAGLAPEEVADRVLVQLTERTSAQAGLILVDRTGRVSWRHNAIHMPGCVLAPNRDETFS
jgi:beta-aspartyl-peptidase (threonine type)